MSIELVLERHLLTAQLPRRTDHISADEPLFQSGLLDSLALVRLLVFVEDEFGVVLDDADVVEKNFATINAIADLIRRLQAHV